MRSQNKPKVDREERWRNTLPRLSHKEALILEYLIQGGETYANEMSKASTGRLPRGTVYVYLARMEDRGLVESRPEAENEPTIGLPRRLYRVTGKGQKVYAAWATL